LAVWSLGANPLGGFFPVAAWLCDAVTALVPSSLFFRIRGGAETLAWRRSHGANALRGQAMTHYTNEITNEIESTRANW
jgi:hypothetical protein